MQATKPKLQSWLTCDAGITLLSTAASRPTQVCLQIFVSSSVLFIAIASYYMYTRGIGCPLFPVRWCPSLENEDGREDGGPNKLDPCDCCRRQHWERATESGGLRQGIPRRGVVAARDPASYIYHYV